MYVAYAEVEHLVVRKARLQLRIQEIERMVDERGVGIARPLRTTYAYVALRRERLAWAERDVGVVARPEHALRFVRIRRLCDGADDDMLVPLIRKHKRTRADKRLLRVVRGKDGDACRSVLRQCAARNTGALVRENPRLPFAGKALRSLQGAEPVAVVVDARYQVAIRHKAITHAQFVLERHRLSTDVLDRTRDGIRAAAKMLNLLVREPKCRVRRLPRNQLRKRGGALLYEPVLAKHHDTAGIGKPHRRDQQHASQHSVSSRLYHA